MASDEPSLDSSILGRKKDGYRKASYNSISPRKDSDFIHSDFSGFRNNSTLSNKSTARGGNAGLGIAQEVHHHHHYRPKHHEKNFNWLDYQHERKVSAMSGRTTLQRQQDHYHGVDAEHKSNSEASWADLNQTSAGWNDINWSWDNLVFKYEEFKGTLWVWMVANLGLAATDTNVKAYGSHKGVYIQNLRLTKAMKEHNMFLIHPASNIRLAFDSITLLMMIWLVIQLPYNLAFLLNVTNGDGELVTTGENRPTQTFTVFMEIFSDIWFLFDIFLRIFL